MKNKYEARTGIAIFDFDENKIIFERNNAISTTAIGLKSMAINMGEITDIGLRHPSFTKLGGFVLVIDGIRYITNTGADMTTFSITKKAEFPNMQADLKKILEMNGIKDFKSIDSLTAPKKEWKEDLTIEHCMRCNICGNVYCYTQADIYENERLRKQAIRERSLAVGNAFGGSTLSTHANTSRADNIESKIVDYSKCPKCNSTNISEITKEELMKEQNNNSVSSTTSLADELKKFKELLDMGAITQEEFDAKKKELLGL